jgi:hypothetical protein
MENIEILLAEGKQAAEQATTTQDLDQVRVQYMGKKGHLTQLLKGLGALSPEERPQAGAKINEAKQARLQSINIPSFLLRSGIPHNWPGPRRPDSRMNGGRRHISQAKIEPKSYLDFILNSETSKPHS